MTHAFSSDRFCRDRAPAEGERVRAVLHNENRSRFTRGDLSPSFLVFVRVKIIILLEVLDNIVFFKHETRYKMYKLAPFLRRNRFGGVYIIIIILKCHIYIVYT